MTCFCFLLLSPSSLILLFSSSFLPSFSFFSFSLSCSHSLIFSPFLRMGNELLYHQNVYEETENLSIRNRRSPLIQGAYHQTINLRPLDGSPLLSSDYVTSDGSESPTSQSSSIQHLYERPSIDLGFGTTSSRIGGVGGGHNYHLRNGVQSNNVIPMTMNRSFHHLNIPLHSTFVSPSSPSSTNFTPQHCEGSRGSENFTPQHSEGSRGSGRNMRGIRGVESQVYSRHFPSALQPQSHHREDVESTALNHYLAYRSLHRPSRTTILRPPFD